MGGERGGRLFTYMGGERGDRLFTYKRGERGGRLFTYKGGGERRRLSATLPSLQLGPLGTLATSGTQEGEGLGDLYGASPVPAAGIPPVLALLRT